MDRHEEIEKIREEALNESGIINYDEWLKLCKKDGNVKKVISLIQELCRQVRSKIFAIKALKTKVERLDRDISLAKDQINESERKIDSIIDSVEPIKKIAMEAKEPIIKNEKTPWEWGFFVHFF